MIKWKRNIIVSFVIIVGLIIWGTRVFYVNKGVAKEYTIHTYNLNHKIVLDDAILKITGIKYGQMEKNNQFATVPVTVNMQITNVSDKTISVISLIEAKFAFGRDYFQTRDGNFDPAQLQNLNPQKSLEFTLIYHINPKYKNKTGMLYIPQNLYEKQVKRQYEKGYRLGMAVRLKD
jgi:hypothetical protein